MNLTVKGEGCESTLAEETLVLGPMFIPSTRGFTCSGVLRVSGVRVSAGGTRCQVSSHESPSDTVHPGRWHKLRA